MHRRLSGLQPLLLAATLGASWHSPVYAGSSCPLTPDEQRASISAFEPIASFLTHEPRCFNCHGGVNPFVSGTGADPDDKDAPPSSVKHGGGLILRKREKAKDGTVLVESECMDCHNNMAPRRDGSKSLWFLAPSFLSFVGKDAPTLCKQVKRSTRSAEHFLGHLEDDEGGNNFGGTAYMGNRGLDADVYDLEPAPPSISHAKLMALASAWIDAMNGSFPGDESCGCEIRDEYEGSFSQTSDWSTSLPVYGVGAQQSFKVSGRLVWSPDPDKSHAGNFNDVKSAFFVVTDGEIAIESVHTEGRTSAGACQVEGSKTFTLKDLPPEALNLLSLEVAEDGRYRVMLGIVSRYLQFEATQRCKMKIPVPLPGGNQKIVVNSATLALGQQEGRLTDGNVVGRTERPVMYGDIRVSGEWQFEKKSSGAPNP